MDSQVIASLIAVLGTLGGAFLTSWVHRDSKKIYRDFPRSQVR